MVNLKRRDFITLAIAGGSIAVGTHLFWKRGFSGFSIAQQSQNTPTLYQSQNGVLEVELEARLHPIQIGATTAHLLTYNGLLPGPRLEARPGDRVIIHFKNSLKNPTNLHYHGLHIPPTGKADNVFLEIKPKEKFTYEFQIPANHPPGTFWYHPHLHGYTADQVSGGLAGLFVIRGDIDEIPELQQAQEEFLVLQDFALDQQGRLFSSENLSIMAGREGSLITGNGQQSPTFTVPHNGLLRLRILNASTSRFYRLSLGDIPFYLIGADGGAIPQPVEFKELLMTPGQRREILIPGEPSPYEYQLLNLPYNRGGMGMMGGGMMGGGMMGGGMMGRGRGRMGRDRNPNPDPNPTVLATIQHQGTGDPVPLPTQLTSLEHLPTPTQVRQFTLNHGMSPGQGMVFLINGQAYNHQRIDTSVQLNTVEDWEITNNGVMDHPFHVHVNPFQVLSRDGQAEPYRAWQDTVLVRSGETVRLRMRFADFPGKTVYHCHILDHEDLGMMGNLEIL